MTIPQDWRAPARQQRMILLENVGGDTLSAFAVCEVVGSYRPESATTETPGGGVEVLQVQTATQDDPCNWAIVGPCDIEIDKTGPGTKDYPFIVLTDGDLGDAAECGIEAGKQYLVADRCGFITDGDYDAGTGTMRVSRLDNCQNTTAIVWLKAIDCIELGSTTGTATRQASKTGPDDPAYASPVTVNNEACTAYAIKDEIFPCLVVSRRCSGVDPEYIPIGGWGLSRTVKVESPIDHGSTGSGKVYSSPCAGSGGSCTRSLPADPCQITFCNELGRPIAPCGYEDVRIRAEGCCWTSVSGNAPARATATLTAKLCPEESVANVTASTFPDCPGTGWCSFSTAANPHGLPGCVGSTVEMVPRFTGGAVVWDIVQIEPKIVTRISAKPKIGCDATTCTLQHEHYNSVALWSCDDTVCTDTPATTTIQTGSLTEAVTGVTVTCGDGSGTTAGNASLNVTTVKICSWCSASPSTASTTIGTHQMVAVGIYDSGSCLQQTLVEIVSLCAGTSASSAVPGVECTTCASGS